MVRRIGFILLFYIHYLHAFNIKIPSNEPDKRITLTTNLIDKCFPDVRASMFISDSSVEGFSNDFLKAMIVSVIVLDKSTNYSIPENQNTPVPCVIMILSSPAEMKRVFANETWRNFDQFFIILDGGDSDNGCSNAQSFLMEAWNNDILNVIFMCLDYQNQVPKVYSFNPFTNSAPMSWTKISVVSALNDHPWTLLSQSYNTDDESCKNLFFDKASDLGGYPIKVGVFDIPPYITYKTKNGVTTYEGYDYEIVKLLVSELNGTLVIDNEIARFPEQFDKEDKSSLLWWVAIGRIDLAIDSLILRKTSQKAESTYPFQQATISVMTQYREFKILAEHLLSFISWPIALLFFVASVFIYLILLYVLKDPYSRFFIDIIRFYLNLPLPTMPLFTRGRIVFVIASISFMFGNIIFQAHLNTEMTTKNIARNVESMEDLKELNYKVLAGKFMKSLMEQNGVEKVELVPDNLYCSQLKDDEAYADKDMTLRTLMSGSCHLPRRPLISGMFQTYYTCRNWPIFPKINKKLQMLFESGLADYQMKQILKKYQQPKRQEPEQSQPLSINYMEYVFYFFIAIFLISMITFVLELFTAWLFRNRI